MYSYAADDNCKKLLKCPTLKALDPLKNRMVGADIRKPVGGPKQFYNEQFRIPSETLNYGIDYGDIATDYMLMT